MTWSTVFLRIAAALWVVWGLVHMFAGVVVMSSDTAGAIAAIADATDPASHVMDYTGAAGAVINQHGFNLLWIGAVTTICAVFIWRGAAPAIFLAAITGGLADVGYFLFLDLGGYVHFIPGTLMTLFSSSAILLSFIAHFRGRSAPAAP